MPQTEKFLFDEHFDSEKAEHGDAAKKTKAPTFTEADLAAAEQRGFDAGRSAGLREAEQSAEERIAESLDALSGQLGELNNQMTRSQAQHQRDTLQLACHALGKLFPALAQQGALGEAEQVIESCLARLRYEPRIVLRTADDLHDLLRDRIEVLASRAGFEGRIVLLTEEDMGPSDVRVEWADGGAERDTAGLWAEIEEIVARTLGAAETSSDPVSSGAPAQDIEQAPQPETIEPERPDRVNADPDLGHLGASA